MSSKKKSWYAVKVGRETGLFTDWELCKKQVVGYPGAVYKGFYTKEEANAFLLGENKSQFLERENLLAAYVDGSYMPSMPEAFSYGVVFVSGKNIETAAKRIVNAELATMRNVAGEIYGARYAMETCVARGIQEVILYYDYAGIEKWCTGEWKANKKGTQELRDYYLSIRKQLTVYFRKVKSHSGVTYNEMADQIAKKALLGEKLENCL